MAARKRKNVVLEKRVTSQEPRPVKDIAKSNFEWKLWLLFCVENWVLDFGRPIFALIVSANFPLSLPSIGDYCHMLYNVITALVLIALLQSSVTAVPKLIQVKTHCFTNYSNIYVSISISRICWSFFLSWVPVYISWEIRSITG